MTILKNPIPGYNNSITTSTLNMRFGVNQNLNKVKNKTAASHPPLKFSGDGGEQKKKSGFLGRFGDEQSGRGSGPEN